MRIASQSAQRRLVGLVNRGPSRQSSVLQQPRNGVTNSSSSSNSSGHFDVAGTRSFHATTRAFAARRDLYEVLGASRDDDKNAIKKKYFKLAKEYHPDSNKGDDSAKEKFHEISAAYEVLSDEDKRSLYDATGQTGDEQPGMGGGGGQGFDPNDIFSQMFNQAQGGGGFGGFGGGGGFGQQQQEVSNRGNDINVSARLSFLEAALGVEKTLNYNAMKRCKPCKGSGANENKPEKKKCKSCRGTGFVEQILQGMFRVQQPCGTCGGKGHKIKNPCKSCRGRGVVAEKKEHTVQIPAGLFDDQILRVDSGGHAGDQGGPYGHLNVSVQTKPDPYFKRKGSDVHTTTPISLAAALMGGTVPVATLKGEVDITVKERTAHGDRKRLPGYGIVDPQTRHQGDHYVHIEVEMPKVLSERQLELIKEFEVLEAEKGERQKSQDIMDAAAKRVKEYKTTSA